MLDTNVVLSALVWSGGTLERLVTDWQSGLILPLRNFGTTQELERVLSYPRLGLAEDRQQILLAAYLPWCEEISISHNPRVPNPRDPNDRPFLELALAGNADALVTGDNDLLVLAPNFPVPIITPSALGERLTARN